MKTKILLLFVLLVTSININAAIRYVNINVSGGTADGTSWTNAFSTLQSALNIAVTGDQIWVAKGTYYPTADPFGNTNPTDPRDKTFYLKDGVAIYGGFAGTESAINQRLSSNVTVLDGDIGTIGSNTDNCYHVVLSVSDGNNTILNGLIIKNGHANGNSIIVVETKGITRYLGGGIYNTNSTLNLMNVSFIVNSASIGGGIYSESGSTLSITNAVFSANGAGSAGGIVNDNSSLNLTNVVFSKNSGGTFIGGLYNTGVGTANLTNVTFSENVAGVEGGGITQIDNSSMTLKNCVFWGNMAGGVGDDIKNKNNATLTASYTSMQLVNNTTNYPTASFPNIGTSNNIFAQNPLFVNSANPAGTDNIFMTADDGLELQSASPCKDAGTATGASTTDITGASRLGNVDMGAYEFRPCPIFTNNIAYVNTNATGSNTGVDWTNAFTSLESALNAARTCGVTQIWVAKGTYKPSAYPTNITGSPTLTNRDFTFHLVNGVAMYGGFAGTETATTQRTGGNETILSGDIGTVGVNTDNCYHVLLSVSDNNTTKVDGFTVTGGNANDEVLNTSVTVETKSIPLNAGGGMYNHTSSPILTNCIFSTNNAASTGGGMTNNASSPTLTTITFTSNTAMGVVSSTTGSGGGMMNFGGSSPILTNVNFSMNNSVSGGGMYNSGASPSLSNCSFIQNNAKIGGGMCNAVFSMSGVTAPVLNQVTFTSNTATNEGGGMYNSGATTPTITNSSFESNTATNKGGGMRNYLSAEPMLTTVIFSQNSAGDGGGMSNNTATPILTNIFFNNNSATSQYGGGMENNFSSPGIVNVVFYKNVAKLLGAGMFNNGSSPALTNATFLSNTTQNMFSGGGAGMYNSGTSILSMPTIMNGIFWDNSSISVNGVVPSDVSNSSNSTLMASYTSMQFSKNTTNYPTAGFPDIGTSNNLFAQNPLFVNPNSPSGIDNIFMTADDGLELQSTSPCINVGTATWTIATDITGAARVGNVDMGAYEFQGVVSCNPPTATTAGSNSPVTVGSPINLTSSSTGGTSQVWAGPNTFTSTDQNPIIALATMAMAGIYTVTITSSGTCTATATVNVVVNPAPTVCSPPTGATAGSNSPVTVGSPINLTSSSTGGNIQVWAGPNTFTSTDQNPIIALATMAMAGVYTVTITSSGTCTATATVNVVVNPAPTVCSPPTAATAVSNSPVTVGSPINLTSSSTGGTSQVWAGPSSFSSTAQNPSIASSTLVMAGIYTVTITSSGTCTATVTVNVVVNPLPTGAVVFVNVANISPTQDGNSWATAYSNLQTALSASPANSEIWVAQGTYKPTTTTTKTIYFNIPNGAMLFGGFVGTEVAQLQRNFKNNPTILSGEIGSISTTSDNSYHVVTFVGANNTTRLDGFTITGGNANLTPDKVRPSPSMAVVQVSINDGGGIALDNGSSPMIINCKILNNDAVFGGGIFATNGSNPTVMNCTFMGNQATFGGGVYHLGSNPSYNNVLFAGNKATGGAVYNNGSNPTITNVTIAGNGGLNGAIFNSASTPVVKNSIIYGNIMPFNDTQSVVTYSIVEGGFKGIGNLNLNPQFINPTHYGLSPNTSGDYQLTNTSPAIDAGENGTISLTDKDLVGNLRRYNGGIVDMGAYEFQGSRVGGTVISITSGNWENGSTWMGGVRPLAGDNVIINNNHNVTLNATGTAKNVEIRTNAKIVHSSASSKLQVGI